MHNVLRRSGQIAVLTATLGMSIITGPAAAAPPTERICLSNLFDPPDSLNARYGVDERIIGPPGCLDALAGEHWARAVPPWVTATDAGIAAFRQNFVSARWVIDAGTPQEFTVTAGPESLQSGPPEDPFTVPSGPFAGKPFITPVSPAIRPLSVGTHTNIVFVTMSAETCNGLGGLAEICLPAGESQYASPFFPSVGHLVPASGFNFVAPTP